MNDIKDRIELAKSNGQALECLVSDYIPFIKKQISAIHLTLDFDDMLSIAMLTFSGCVMQYDISKGNFISFVSTSIKNRLIDEARKEGRYTNKAIALFCEDGTIASPVEDISLQKYSRELERQALSYEIDELSAQLLFFAIAFHELPKISPKQERSRALCIKITKVLISNEDMKNQLFVHKKIAQAELADQLDISVKTIEKYRKYIVTLAVLMVGDYPNIKAFLPQYREVK